METKRWFGLSLLVNEALIKEESRRWYTNYTKQVFNTTWSFMARVQRFWIITLDDPNVGEYTEANTC